MNVCLTPGCSATRPLRSEFFYEGILAVSSPPSLFRSKRKARQIKERDYNNFPARDFFGLALLYH